MSWNIAYYSTTVQDAIREWPPRVRADFVQLTRRMLEHGANLGMPKTRAMGGGLFELPCHGREGIGRALFCTRKGQEIMLLHAFIKKTEKTPARELEIARTRMKELKHEDA